VSDVPTWSSFERVVLNGRYERGWRAYYTGPKRDGKVYRDALTLTDADIERCPTPHNVAMMIRTAMGVVEMSWLDTVIPADA
jgi:hypothetical protein